MNTYLIYSDSYKKRDLEIKKIIQNNLNVIKYDLDINTINEVLNEMSYFSLLDDQKYIIVKADKLFKSTKKDEENKDINNLIDYLNNPNPKCTLIFNLTESPDKRKKLYKLVNSVGKVILLDPLNKKDLTYECINILKNKGYKIDYELANYVVENSYINYDIMTSELDKIFMLIKPKYLDKSDIKDIISLSISNNSFGYINSIINHDLNSAINICKTFEILKIDPIAIVTMLSKEIKILYLLKNKTNYNDVQKLFNKENWQMDSYQKNLNNYTLDELKKIIIKLSDYDYKLKSGLIDKSIILNLIALELCN